MNSNLILADDHNIIRKGMKLLLMSAFGYKNIYEADSCNALLNELKARKCTYLFLDVSFPDGTALEIIPTICSLYPDLRIIIFSMQPDEVYAPVFKRYGIKYYLNKSATENEAINYISKFINNEPVAKPGVSEAMPASPFSLLSERELEILYYLLNGYKTNDIAKALNLGTSTVSTLKFRILEKTKSPNLTHLYDIAALYNISININPPKGR